MRLRSKKIRKRQRSRASKDVRRQRLNLEPLEDRRMLAQIAWDGGGDGTSWTDPLNWDSD